MIKWLSIIFFIFSSFISKSQNFAERKIAGLPSEEIYDIYAGSKGNIWIAHSMGLSRYDGHTVTNFQMPDSSLAGISNICEDKQGRIWCHDFNGNVYFILNEKMFLYRTLKLSHAEPFPVTMILDSELIITTSRGLYVCNTQTLKGKLYNNVEKGVTYKSIAISGKKVISYDVYGAYKYEEGKGLKNIIIIGPDGEKYSDLSRGFYLCPIHTNDTLYAYNNYDIFTLIERNDSLRILKIEKSNGMVNTVTNCNGKIWINTKKCSYTTDKKEFIWGKNLTNIIIDGSGNKWYSSLQDGLTIEPVFKGWQAAEINYLQPHDFIRAMLTVGDNIVYGTQSGNIIVANRNKVLYKLSLPSSAGAVERLFLMPNKSIMVGGSVGLYYIPQGGRKLYLTSNMVTYKSVCVTDSFIYLAISGPLIKLPLSSTIKSLVISNFEDQHSLPGAVKDFDQMLKDHFRQLVYGTNSRCTFIDYDSISKKTIALFNEGFADIRGDSMYMINYQGGTVKASCIFQKNGNTFIGTLNKGLLNYKNGEITTVKNEDGLYSNSILAMKHYENKLYLIEPGYFQIYDLNKSQVTLTVPLPTSNWGSLYDFTVRDNNIYLTFTNSLYKLKINEIGQFKSIAYLLSAMAVISNKSLPNNRLDYDDNNIKIKLSSPTFTYPEATYFMYRLIGSYDTTWKKLEGPVYTVSFPSLTPGDYKFEAYSVNFQNARSANTIVIPFSIKKPWWQRWWFYLAVLFLLFLSITYVVAGYYRRIRKANQLEIDKLTLQNSLRKTLLRTITAQMNPHFIFNAMNTIQSYVYRNDKRSASNYLGKFSELIRKILETSNIDTITLKEEIEILTLYLDLEKARFEDNFHINLQIDPALQPEDIEVPPMFIQPYIENAIKHGLLHNKGSRELSISISEDNEKANYIRIVIDDNGIGRYRSMELNSKSRKYKSFASNANDNRINLINHTLQNKIILSITDKPRDSGTVVTIRLPIINSPL